ncbi:hypothetical protein KKB18_02275, partial [bacterium]|nr:hypothetical protein [bacterium]
MSLKKIDLYALAVFIGACIIISFCYNIYFFLDDYPYFHITENYIAYPSEFTKIFYSFDMWSYYRPLVKVIWIAGYLLWGTSPYGYTSIIALFFVMSALTLYRTGVLLKNRLCGLISAFLFMTYFPVLYSICHKSSTSLLSEICFNILFLYFILKWIKSGNDTFDKNALWAMVFLFLSIISKETSLLLPLTLIPFWRKKNIRNFILITFAISLFSFFIPRLFFISYGPLHQPGFHPDKIITLFDNFIRLQYLTLIGPYTLIAAFFSYRRKHALPLLSIFLFVLILERFFVPPSGLPSRLDLVLSISALIIAFIFTNPYKRFALWWSIILLAPTFSMGDANIHQTLESFIGIALLLGLGFSDHGLLLKKVIKKITRRGISNSLQVAFNKILEIIKSPLTLIHHWKTIARNFALVMLIPLILYSSLHILKANLKDSLERYRYFRDSSQLTKMVRIYLQDVLPPNARIHNNTMPAHISYP